MGENNDNLGLNEEKRVCEDPTLNEEKLICEDPDKTVKPEKEECVCDPPKENPEPESPKKGGKTPKKDGKNPKEDDKNPKEDDKDPKEDDKDPKEDEEEKKDHTPDKLTGKEIVELAGDAVDLAVSTADLVKGLDNATADPSVIKNALGAMESISFDKVIGEPLIAIVKAQAAASRSTLDFIREVGFTNVNGKDQVAIVSFEFLKNGKLAKLHVPLITLVPIPMLKVSEATFDYKLTIKSHSSLTVTNSSGASKSIGFGIGTPSNNNSSSKPKNDNGGQNEEAEKKNDNKTTPEKAEGGGAKGKDTPAKSENSEAAKAQSEAKAAKDVKDSAKVEAGFNVSFSSKKDSTATKDSKYSVEATMDVKVTVVDDPDVPMGISKILEVLGDATEVIDADGRLNVSPVEVTLVDGFGATSATYLNGDGDLELTAIKCEGVEGGCTMAKVNDEVIITFTKAGVYKVMAGTRTCLVLVN